MRDLTRFGSKPEHIEPKRRSEELKRNYKEKYGLKEMRYPYSMDKISLTAREDNCYHYYFDHPDTFREIATGEYVQVYQPYRMNNYVPFADRDVEKYQADLEAFGRRNGMVGRMSVEESWHYPGSTVLIEFRKALEADRRAVLIKRLKDAGFESHESAGTYYRTDFLTKGPATVEFACGPFSAVLWLDSRVIANSHNERSLIRMIEKAIRLTQTVHMEVL